MGRIPHLLESVLPVSELTVVWRQQIHNRPRDRGHLRDFDHWIREVVERQPAQHEVEVLVGERKPVSGRLHEVQVAQPCLGSLGSRLAQHLRRNVDARDRADIRRDGAAQVSRARGNIEPTHLRRQRYRLDDPLQQVPASEGSALPLRTLRPADETPTARGRSESSPS